MVACVLDGVRQTNVMVKQKDLLIKAIPSRNMAPASSLILPELNYTNLQLENCYYSSEEGFLKTKKGRFRHFMAKYNS